jgi:predicted ATP-binding protein involved in virulence
MRIDQIELRNFKKFAQATFEFPRPVNAPADAGSFHVLIGENGTGKTSILDAVAVALGVWLEKVPDSLLANSYRHLTTNDKRLTATPQGDRMLPQQVPDPNGTSRSPNPLGAKRLWLDVGAPSAGHGAWADV